MEVRKDKRTSSKSSGDQMEKRMARLEESRAKDREETNGKFQGLNDLLRQLKDSLVSQSSSSVVVEDSQERGKKRKAMSPRATVESNAHKRSSRELLVRGDFSDEERSEDEALFDSDAEGGAERSDSSEEERDTVDINPQGASTFKPSDEQAATWLSHLKRGEQHGPIEWTRIKVDRSVKKWTSHKAARGFKAPARNLQLPAIKSFDVERDRSFTNLQNMVGAQAAMPLELWACMTRLWEQHGLMIKAAKQALTAEGLAEAESLDQTVSTVLKNARTCRSIVDKELSLGMKDSIHISAAMFNKITLCRRKMTVKGLGDFKGAKDRLEECQPSNEFLFGNDLKELAKAMKEESHFKGRDSFKDSSSSFFHKKCKKFSQDGYRNKQGQAKGGKGFPKRNAAIKSEKE